MTDKSLEAIKCNNTNRDYIANRKNKTKKKQKKKQNYTNKNKHEYYNT